MLPWFLSACTRPTIIMMMMIACGRSHYDDYHQYSSHLCHLNETDFFVWNLVATEMVVSTEWVQSGWPWNWRGKPIHYLCELPTTCACVRGTKNEFRTFIHTDQSGRNLVATTTWHAMYSENRYPIALFDWKMMGWAWMLMGKSLQKGNEWGWNSQI